MPFQLFRRTLISALLITLVIPDFAFASMLDPESDTPVAETPAPSSALSLKQQLDAARQTAGSTLPVNKIDTPPAVKPIAPAVTYTVPAVKPLEANTIIKTPDPIVHKEVIYAGMLDDTKPVGQQIIKQAAQPVIPNPVQATPKAVSQQIVRFDSDSVAAAPASDMHDLLFDDAVQKTSTTQTSAIPSATVTMPKIPEVPVQDDYVPAPAAVPIAKTYTPRIVPAKQPTFDEETSQPAAAMPPPAALPIPTTMANNSSDNSSNDEPIPETPRPKIVSAKPVIPPFVTAVEIRKAPDAPSERFKPKPSKERGEWVIRNLKPTNSSHNDALCLLQNRFDNNSMLVIGEDSLGRVLVAIDYGVEMFSNGQEYSPKVEIDDNYSKNIAAYANGPRKLMIQVNNDPDFLAALQSGDALHVGLKGTASTFALQTMNQGLQTLSKCVSDIGGPPLPAPLLKKHTASTDKIAMPAVPIPSVVQENLTSSAPVPITPPAPPSIVQPEVGYWPDATLKLLKQSGIIPYELQSTDIQVQWSNANGIMHSSAQRIPVADLVDASSLLLDKAEKICGGQFASQMGVPEKRGPNDILQMESKCVRGNSITVTTWAIAKDARGVTSWQMEAPRDQRGLAFDARQQILNSLAR